MYILPIADNFERHQIRYHIYADDTRLHAECPPLNQADALRKIDEYVRDIRRWLNCNHLLLNETNTGAIIFRSTTVRSPAMSTIDLCGSAVSLTPTVRDSGLDMSAQLSNACRAAYINLFRIAKIRTSGSTTGTLYCVASPTASCTVLRWYSGRRPELVCGLGGATGEA